MLQKKCCPFHQIIINVHISQNFPHDFIQLLISTAVLNIDNNEKCFLITKSAY